MTKLDEISVEAATPVPGVRKRDGRTEPLREERLLQLLETAAQGLSGVSAEQILADARVQFHDGLSTANLHEILIKSAADRISAAQPDYQYLAGRLLIGQLRKTAYGQFTPPSLLDHVRTQVQAGRYDAHLLRDYTEAEYAQLDAMLDHTRDLQFAYAAVRQLEGKYLVQNRVSRQVHESPQMLYLLIGMCLFAEYPAATRLSTIQRFYDAVSGFKLSLPTPIMSGVRTPSRQFSSCVLIECDDSLDSINATTSAIVRYVSMRAGIGINAGRIRAVGSPIRGGEAQHTGMLPFFKLFQSAVKSCSQGGVRGGAATLFYPLWHLEVESLLVLKNNRGVEENRVRHLDYGVQINRLLYQRLIEGGNITLFSPHDVPGLYDAFFADQAEFERLYAQYEADPSIRKRSIQAVELFSLLMQERAGTGRIYIQNVDHCNTHSPFDPRVAPIRQSNLCLEIALPTRPLNDLHDTSGEIALCTLSAFNLGAIESLDELEDLADLAVRSLDALLDYQDYPVEAARESSMKRRTLGIGVINFANYLAKNGVRYSDGSANALTHRAFEAIQYHLLRASNRLAKERGACPAFDETTYAQGILPIDSYKKDLDAVCSEPLQLDWETLRQDIRKHGLRNSTLTALMPSETSSQISNATNGIEPPRGLVSVKQSKDGILRQVVPDIRTLGHQYELLWEIPDNDGYLQLVGIMQKFVDQAISANTNYDPQRFEGGKVPVRVLIKDLLTAYKYGLKTLYYHNTRDGADDGQHDMADDCAGGACKI